MVWQPSHRVDCPLACRSQLLWHGDSRCRLVVEVAGSVNHVLLRVDGGAECALGLPHGGVPLLDSLLGLHIMVSVGIGLVALLVSLIDAL